MIEIIGYFKYKNKQGIWKTSEALNEKDFVYLEGKKIPVFSLKGHIKEYEDLGREKDKPKIKEMKKLSNKDGPFTK